MFLGNHRFFDGIHTAYRRAIIITTGGVPGTDALNKSNFLGFLMIRGTDNVPFEGTGGAQDSLKLDTGNHIGVSAIAKIGL